MLAFVQNFMSPRGNPIGIDFGTDCLRLAQVQPRGGEFDLIAAASADVPAHVRRDAGQRQQFFTDTVRDLLAQGEFRGRKAMLSMPASLMHVLHLRMAKLDDAETKSQLPFEVRGKLPIDPSNAILRHIVAGEIFQDGEPKNEVIVLAAAREAVNGILGAAARAKLDVVGMNVEPRAIVDCFAQVYRRQADAESVTMYIDIGHAGTRATIARGTQLFFSRSIPLGGEHFARAVSSTLQISLDDAKLARIAAAAPPELEGHAADAVRGVDPRAEQIEFASAETVLRLIEELDLCRRYHEATFSTARVEKLLFVGGESRQRTLCTTIARQLGVAAQVGDPFVRISKDSRVGIETGIDRRLPQPGWAVAIGLSLGGVAVNHAAVAR